VKNPPDRTRDAWRALLCGFVPLLAAAYPAGAQQVVRMPGADRVIQREARTLFTVGEADGAGAFGALGDVAFDAAENLYVLDRLNQRVVVFDSAGRLVRTFGRRGGGPGEFGAPQQLAVTRAGEIVVSDVGRRTLSFFHGDGRFVRSQPYAGASMLIGKRLATHPHGGVVSLAMGNPAAGGASAFGEEVLLWVPTSPGTPRALASVSKPRSRASTTGAVTVHAPPFFAPGFHFGVLPDGTLAVADGAGWTIRILDSSGRVVRRLERPVQPRRVTARDRERAVQRQAREEAEGGGLRLVGARAGPVSATVRRSLAEQLRNAEFARVIPVITGIVVHPSGTLWIGRSGPAADRPGSIDVVTPQGRYVGTIPAMELPAAFSPHGRAAFVRTDALGVERVVVMRL
jgi:hypothetical protein